MTNLQSELHGTAGNQHLIAVLESEGRERGREGEREGRGGEGREGRRGERREGGGEGEVEGERRGKSEFGERESTDGDRMRDGMRKGDKKERADECDWKIRRRQKE